MRATERDTETDACFVEVAEGLVDEFPDLPVGRVLRCFAEAVRHARGWGCPSAFVLVAATSATRVRLVELSRGAGCPQPVGA